MSGGDEAAPAAPPTPTGTRRARSFGGVRNLIGWGVSVACLGLLAWRIDFRAAFEALKAFEWAYLLLAVLSLAFGYTMRIIRWRVMLNATGASVSVGECAAPFLGSIALNNVLPLRIGDVVRAVVFPAAIGVSRPAAIGSVAMERLVDLLTLLLCLVVGVVSQGSIELPQWLRMGAILAGCGAVTALLAIIFLTAPLIRLLSRLGERFRTHPRYRALIAGSETLLEGLQKMASPSALGGVLGVSLLVWAGEAGVYFSMMVGGAISATPAEALMVMAVVTLSTLVPSSPGYVGPFHLAAFAAVSLLGASADKATSFAVLAHLAVWVPTTLAGGVALLLRPDLFRGVFRR